MAPIVVARGRACVVLPPMVLTMVADPPPRLRAPRTRTWSLATVAVVATIIVNRVFRVTLSNVALPTNQCDWINERLCAVLTSLFKTLSLLVELPSMPQDLFHELAACRIFRDLSGQLCIS